MTFEVFQGVLKHLSYQKTLIWTVNPEKCQNWKKTAKFEFVLLKNYKMGICTAKKLQNALQKRCLIDFIAPIY